MIVRGTPPLLRRLILLLFQVLYIPILYSIAVNMFFWGYLFLFPLFVISSSERIENSIIYRSVIKMRQGLRRNAVGIPLRSMFYNSYERDMKDVVLSTFLPTIILSTAFGGMHCLAWNFPFPTSQEQFYWRVAVCLLTATIPLIFSFFITACFIFAGYSFLHFITDKTCPVSGYWVGSAKAFDYLVAQRFIGRTLGSLIFYYVLSRIGVLVMGFTTLRSLSDSALHNVEWTSHIPHIQWWGFPVFITWTHKHDLCTMYMKWIQFQLYSLFHILIFSSSWLTHRKRGSERCSPCWVFIHTWPSHSGWQEWTLKNSFATYDFQLSFLLYLMPLFLVPATYLDTRSHTSSCRITGGLGWSGFDSFMRPCLVLYMVDQLAIITAPRL